MPTHSNFTVELFISSRSVLTSDIADDETNDYNPGNSVGTIPQVGDGEQG